MKTIFTALFALTIWNGYAQNVGVGTRDPKNKLHVAGGVRIDSLAARKDSGLILHNPSGDLFSLQLTGNKKDVLHGDGTFSAAAAATDAWLLGGNAGTDSATNFLGTLDNRPMMFRLNNEYFGTFSMYNIAVGQEALGFNFVNELGRIGGRENVAIGNFSLRTTTGIRNVGVGSYTMADISGDENTAVGALALTGRRESNGIIGSGDGNVAIGSRALSTIHSGSRNTAIGAGSLSGVNSFGDVRITDNTAVGYHSLKNLAPYEGPTQGNNVAVGAFSLFGNIHGASNTALGYEALYAGESPFNLTAVGYRALYANTAGVENTAIGHSSLMSNTTGNNNTAVGNSSLSRNTAGQNNTATGQSALTLNTTGRNNTATGNESLKSNTTGLDNTAVGHAALQATTTGNYNTSSGSQSLFANKTGSYNSAYGFKAMFTNTTGNNNTATGFKALNFTTSGSKNTATDFEALNTNTTGSNNTAIGYRADVTSGNFTNATAVGYEAKVNASNKVRIGNAAVTVIEGQVPFTTPSDGRFEYNVKENVVGLDFVMKLRPVTYQFDVRRFDGQDNTSYASSNNVAYEQASRIRRTGFIAQEVDEAAQESGYDFSGIVRPASAVDHFSLSYESFVVPMVKAIQEQQAIIERQQTEIDQLKQLIKNILPKP